MSSIESALNGGYDIIPKTNLYQTKIKDENFL